MSRCPCGKYANHHLCTADFIKMAQENKKLGRAEGISAASEAEFEELNRVGRHPFKQSGKTYGFMRAVDVFEAHDKAIAAAKRKRT